MGVAKCMITGSDYIGVFAAVSDRYVFFGNRINERSKRILAETLKAHPIGLSIFATDLIGLFIKANSNGILVSRMIEDYELKALRELNLDLRMEVLESNLNAVGNNILANDRIALVNPDYHPNERKQIQDVLGVEVMATEIGGFKTVGANNILTNKGFVINNRATDQEKERIDRLLGFESTRTTANTGALSVGLSAVGNSTGIVAGENTTGYELNRIIEALNIE